MKVDIERSVLLRGLQRLQSVVERRNTMPVLGHILMQAEGEGLSLFGTDLEIGIRTEYPAVVHEKGKATVLGRKIYEIVRELPEGAIRLERLPNHWFFISAGSSRFKVMGLPVEDYPVHPPIPEQPFWQVSRKALLDLIRKTLFAVGENDARYVLNGVLFDLRLDDGQCRLRLVGTDGHRLAMLDRVFPCVYPTGLPAGEAGRAGQQAPGDPGAIQAIIPKKTLQEIRKILEESDLPAGREQGGDPELAFTKNQVLFRQGQTLLLSRLMEGTYPNYEQVIPRENDKYLTAGRAALEGALRRVSLLSREKTHAVKLELEPNRLTLHSNSPDLGEAREDLEVQYQGETLSAGFNARYLLDILGVLEGEEAQMAFKDALSPCLVRESGDKDYVCVVMPMRL